MFKNPSRIKNGKPECYGGYEEDNRTCTLECPHTIWCAIETRDEDKRVDSRNLLNGDGRRMCFGELYSPNSYECNNACDHAFDCERMKDFKEGNYNPSYRVGTNSTPSTRATIRQQTSPTGIRSEALNVLQPRMITQPSRVDDQTRRYVERKYGKALHPDPVIPGQFENEEWYVRFFKEVAKYAGYYALQLLSNVLINSWWAPSGDKNEIKR